MKKENVVSYKKTFVGIVKKIAKPIASIQFEKIVSYPKYERFSKSTIKIKARIPKELMDKIQVGDEVVIAECRPLSKTIHHVIQKIKFHKEIKK